MATYRIRTHGIYSSQTNEAEAEAIRYIDEVLQVEDIGLTESVQRGMRTPAFTSGRLVHDPEGSGVSEHGIHRFQSLLLDAYRAAPAGGERSPQTCCSHMIQIL